jgi:aspartokinase
LGQDISKLKVGGLKILEEGAGVVSSFPGGALHLLQGICSPLAQKRINLTFLSHVAGAFGEAEDYTVFCTDLAAGMAGFTQVKAYTGASGQVGLHAPTCIISLYPHDKRADLIGGFLRALGRARVMVLSLASSPSAISAVLSEQAKDRALERLFRIFQFPGYATPAEFYAIQRPPEALVREVVAAYQEQVIKIYQLVRLTDLDFWSFSIPSSTLLENLGAALMALSAREVKILFLVALPGPEDRFVCSFCTVRERSQEVARLLEDHIPVIPPHRLSPMAALFFHGPHFGDRYGVADTLVKALHRVNVPLVALSCTVSSISAIIKEEDLSAAVQVVMDTFEDQSQGISRG